MIQFFAFEDMAPSPPPFPPLKVFLLSFWQVEALPITARRRVGVGEWEFPKWPGILYLFFFLCCSQTKYRNPVKKYKYFPSFYVHTSNESLHYKTIVDTTKGGQANLQVFKFLSSIRKCTSANFCGMQFRQSQIRKFFMIIRNWQIRKFVWHQLETLQGTWSQCVNNFASKQSQKYSNLFYKIFI
jgi:hypothetical protein